MTLLKRRNFLFISKPGHSTHLQEWKGILDTPESFRDSESLGNANNLRESKNLTGKSSNASENCAKNLLTDFSAEVTNKSNRDGCLNAAEFSGVHLADSDRDSPPLSPLIPSRFRKISNITPPRDRRKGVAGEHIY